MAGYGILDGTNNAVSSDLMRNVHYFDFPMESLEGDDLNGGYWDAKLQSLAPILSEVLANSSLPSGVPTCSASITEPSLSGPRQEPVLKGVPNSVDETVRAGIYSDGPVTVQGNLSSCSSEKRLPTISELFSCSKRSRLSNIYPHHSAAPKEEFRTNLFRQLKKKKKLTKLSGATEIKQKSICLQKWRGKKPRSAGSKRCLHCLVRDTPQWRHGPAGPKSLCSACGQRYRSGSLIAEYRLAASPTFVPSLHSNFHKQVVEMRQKVHDFMPIPSDALVGSSLAFGGNVAAIAGEESADVPMPNVVGSVSRSSSSPHSNYSNGLDSRVVQTPSPVSAHQSSSGSCSSETPSSFSSRMVTRSMRSRLSTTNPHHFEESPQSKGFPESNIANACGNPIKGKPKLHLNLPQTSGTTGTPKFWHFKTRKTPPWKLHANTTKKCSHCESTKTPQWRHGPMGRKTLCNACGVRYKVGRLCPEYRPAGSPAFVPSLHSSFQKVVNEMRKRTSKAEAETEPLATPLPESVASEQHH